MQQIIKSKQLSIATLSQSKCVRCYTDISGLFVVCMHKLEQDTCEPEAAVTQQLSPVLAIILHTTRYDSFLCTLIAGRMSLLFAMK